MSLFSFYFLSHRTQYQHNIHIRFSLRCVCVVDKKNSQFAHSSTHTVLQIIYKHSTRADVDEADDSQFPNRPATLRETTAHDCAICTASVLAFIFVIVYRSVLYSHTHIHVCCMFRQRSYSTVRYIVHTYRAPTPHRRALL